MVEDLPPGDDEEPKEKPDGPTAALDSAHVGDIQGAFGTIREHDLAARRSWWKKLLTLLAIAGPGLIVMVGDNDAGASRPTPRPVRTSASACCGPFHCWSRS